MISCSVHCPTHRPWSNCPNPRGWHPKKGRWRPSPGHCPRNARRLEWAVCSHGRAHLLPAETAVAWIVGFPHYANCCFWDRCAPSHGGEGVLRCTDQGGMIGRINRLFKHRNTHNGKYRPVVGQINGMYSRRGAGDIWNIQTTAWRQSDLWKRGKKKEHW